MVKFISPDWLYLLLSLAPLWVVALARPGQRTARLGASLALRSLAIIALSGALSGAQRWRC